MQGFFSKLSPQEKKIFYIAVIVIVLVAFDRLFLGPITDKLKSIDAEALLKENVIKRDTRFLVYEDRINLEYKVFSKYFTKELAEEDIIKRDFLGKIEQLANNSSVSLAKNSFSNIQKHKSTIEYYTNLECTGTLENMLNFIYTINSGDDLLKVTTFNMSAKRGA
ncbi:MAG: hypothetical protein HQL27_08965, partial [Candidatus Omnitrophica bacterium]|nr:hypothetical protein [Candidatus Omnitrophota bacterium]